MKNNDYEVIVVGGGHAGIEAALACARLHHSTLLITMSKKWVGSMPCNPSLGGPAKGVVVREIDALGGQMGLLADQTALQFKMLNTTKGPGVRCLRVQSDKEAYSALALQVLEKQENLTIKEATVQEIIVENNRVKGVKTTDEEISSEIVILTTGTYMNSAVMVSAEVTISGPDGQPTTKNLSESLKQAGIKLFRLKTGTPARIYSDSIDFTKTSIQPGDDAFNAFSFMTEKIKPFEQQLPCYLTYTNATTHQIIKDNLLRSSLYSGVITGIGPRYCPSIEDKVVRFADKERHQIFLEPETKDFDTTYVQGFSTSLPRDAQELMIHSLQGLEFAKIAKYAYAMEYDAIDPLQLLPSLELKNISHLFSAGQINGTSGYEEAAGQGLLAGINACLKLENKAALVLRRDQAYIGVMIDDLVTKGTKEPYRLLTSRAEYRLLLRHDNADLRLTELGREVGLVNEERYSRYQNKLKEITTIREEFANMKLNDQPQLNQYWQTLNWDNIPKDLSFLEILKRPHVEVLAIKKLLALNYSDEALTQVAITCKYGGYIDKAIKEADKLKQMEQLKIPVDFDYQSIKHLSLEAKSKLSDIKPITLGQASRISGVNPADIAILVIYLTGK